MLQDLDASALVKLVVPEAETVELTAFVERNDHHFAQRGLEVIP